MQSMRMLLSFGVRRHMVHAAPEPSYEAMLALDENNPRRGVKKHILEGLPHVWAPFSDRARVSRCAEWASDAAYCLYREHAACMYVFSVARLANLQDVLVTVTY